MNVNSMKKQMDKTIKDMDKTEDMMKDIGMNDMAQQMEQMKSNMQKMENMVMQKEMKQ